MGKKLRITVDVPARIESDLDSAHIEDGAGPSTRARLLFELWYRDMDVRAKVVQLLREERRRAAEERT